MKDLILFENEHLFVIDKPAGLIINNANTTRDVPTLQKMMFDQFPELYTPKEDKDMEHDFYRRSGIVHRLDKDTSGVIVVAKTQLAFEALQAQFKEREIEKKYMTLVYGKIKDAAVGDEFEINAPITRNRKNRGKFAVDVNGKEAVTFGKVIKILEDADGQVFSLLECYPKTGRTHQIRVHLAALNTPVYGDSLYSGKKRYKTNLEASGRQFLHSYFIKFADPATGKDLEVESNLPADLQNVLDSLKEV